MPSAHSPLDLPSPPPSSLQADDEKSKETKKRTHAFHHSSSHASHKKDTPQRRQDQEEEEEETPTTTTTQLQAPLKRGLSSPNPGMKRRRCFAGQSSSSSSSQTVGGTGASQEIHAPLIQKETDLFHSPHEEKEEAFHGDADSRNPSASSSAPPFAPLDLPPLQMDGVPLSQRRDLSQSLSRHSSSSSCADGPIASSSSSALKPRSSRFPPHGNEEEEGEGEEEETQHGEEVSRDPPPRQGDEEDDKIHNDIKMKKKRKRRDSNTSGSFLQVSLPPVSPSLILTDWYQLAMLYANWREGRHLQKAVFEGFFRKAPFHGEYAVMAGVKQMIDFISHMRFTEDEIDFFRSHFPNAPEEFIAYLRSIDCSDLSVHAIPEGTIVFPKVPVVRIEGPLGVCTLIETPVLNVLNFSILVATNAARHRLAAGWEKQLLEFGARRAQGPDGALSASRYSYLGGFDGTSNTQAAYLFDIPLRGTMAHSFITSFTSLDQLQENLSLPNSSSASSKAKEASTVGGRVFVEKVKEYRCKMIEVFQSLNLSSTMHEGELAAFTAFAQTFPNSFVGLVDTYDTLYSGVPNALVVCAALLAFGYKPCGIRLDSGDLAYLSKESRRMFHQAAEAFCMPELRDLAIAASNDLNEVIIAALREQDHEIDTFAVGTNLVTCQSQPALGMVYKLVELNSQPVMKVSQVFEKASLPSKKEVYRLFTKDGKPEVDLIQEAGNAPPREKERIFCRHLYEDRKRCFLVPSKVERLLRGYLVKGKKVLEPLSLEEARRECFRGLKALPKDLTRPVNPTPFKVSVTEEYFSFFHRMWQDTAPIHTFE